MAMLGPTDGLLGLFLRTCRTVGDKRLQFEYRHEYYLFDRHRNFLGSRGPLRQTSNLHLRWVLLLYHLGHHRRLRLWRQLINQ